VVSDEACETHIMISPTDKLCTLSPFRKDSYNRLWDIKIKILDGLEYCCWKIVVQSVVIDCMMCKTNWM
jgi:hypothetical protein